MAYPSSNQDAFMRALRRRATAPAPGRRGTGPPVVVRPQDIRPRTPLPPPVYAGPLYGGDLPEPPPTTRPVPAFNFNTDPGYVAALAAEQTGRAQLDAALRQRRIQALVEFGDPELAAKAGLSLDPTSLAAVRASHTSGLGTLARLEKDRGLRRSSLINRLASKNILFSGDLGYGERENESAFGRERFDAQNAMLGGLRSAQDDVLARQQQLRDAVIASMQGAYQNYLANPWLYAGVG